MLPIVLAAVTGMLLAYQPWMERWLEPQHFGVRDDGGEPLDARGALAALREAAPRATLHEVIVPENGARRPYVAQASTIESGGQEQWYALFVDPYSGAVTRRSGAAPMGVIEHFHSTLMVGQLGRYWLGGSAFLLIPLTIVGVYLWWPIRRGMLQRFVRRRDALGWHQVLGLLSLPIVLIIAVTGVTITFYQQAMPLLELATMSASRPDRPVVRSPEDNRADLNSAIRTVEVQYPNARIAAFGEPRAANQPYVIRLRYPGELHPEGWTEVYLHPSSLAILGEFNAFDHSPATAYRHSFVFWHTGDMLGRAGRAVWSMASVALLIMAITGFLHWLRRGRGRSMRSRGRS
ncbi:PepSY domain-containing protein [Ectothiorhodospiraceae bacterium WFHF3C12]|nr:PepSY domain-containing protein [Ectothiorhodospiraceae bacterium WFHF3C12]